MSFTLLIIGATGLVGNEVLKLALQDSRISKVIAVTRRPIAKHAKLENPVVDFDQLPTDAAWWHGVDGAICAIGTTKSQTKSQTDYHKIDVEYPLTIAKILHQHGTKAFALTSSAGASIKSKFPYLKMKGEIEQKLSEVGFSSLTIVRPSFLAGARDKPRPGEAMALFLFRAIQGIVPKRWRPVEAKRVAGALLEAVISAKNAVRILESDKL